MSAANTDKFRKTSPRKATTLSGSVSSGDTTIACTSLTGWPTDTAVDVVINRVDSNGTVQQTWETVTAVVSGSNLTSALRGVEGTASAWGAGTVVEILWTAAQWNDAVDAFLEEHDQDGSHGSITGSSVTVTGNVETSGGAVVTNTVSGKTAGAGVTVDSLLIKDGRVVHWDGWSSAEETWTYASATTFTIAGVDRTARYKKGTKIKLTQGTDKYFVVYSSSFSTNTTITIIPTTDYTLANAAITNPLYSYIEAPAGWPDWFNFDPQFSVSGGTVPTFTEVSMSMWRVIGKRIEVELNHVNLSGGTAGSGGNEFRHVPPTIVPSSIYNNSGSRGFLGMVYSSGINFGYVRMRLSDDSISFTSADASTAALGSSFSGSTRFISARYSYFY